MGEHTKGPWLQHEDYPRAVMTDGNEEDPIAIIASDADARLIAAAPELLEALERVEQRARESGECPFCSQPPEIGCAPACPLTAARAAIKKARGTP